MQVEFDGRIFGHYYIGYFSILPRRQVDLDIRLNQGVAQSRNRPRWTAVSSVKRINRVEDLQYAGNGKRKERCGGGLN